MTTEETTVEHELVTRLQDAINSLQALRADAELAVSGKRGHKSANKRFRRNVQPIRAALKSIRECSLKLEE